MAFVCFNSIKSFLFTEKIALDHLIHKQNCICRPLNYALYQIDLQVL
jgi:hypothetical protein